MNETATHSPPVPPAPASGSAHAPEHSAPAHSAPALPAPIAPTAPRRGDGWGRPLMLAATLAVLLAAVGGWAVWESQGASAALTRGGGLAQKDRTYGYYHDQYFDADSHSPQFKRDGLMGEDLKWDYDGQYRYAKYGSAGMKKRTERPESRDQVLGSTGDRLPNVFDEYAASGQADPTGGDPVGDALLLSLDPGYNPYAGYSNPYLNRIRMAYGPGEGMGAAPGQPRGASAIDDPYATGDPYSIGGNPASW